MHTEEVPAKQAKVLVLYLEPFEQRFFFLVSGSSTVAQLFETRE